MQVVYERCAGLDVLYVIPNASSVFCERTPLNYRLFCGSGSSSRRECKETKRCLFMDNISWEFYPHVAANLHARNWLETQMLLGLAQSTIHAYARSANDYLAFC